MGIKIKYPPTWKVYEQTKIAGLGLQNTTLFNLEHNNTSFDNKLEVTTFDIKPSIDLKEFALGMLENYLNKTSYPNFKPFLMKDAIKETNLLTDTALEDAINDTFNDISTFVFSYNATSNQEFYGLQIFGTALYTDKIYSILFTSEKEKFHRYLPQVLESIKSLEVFKLLSYEDFNMGMKFQYPSDWTYTNGNSIETSFLSYVDDIIFYPTKKENTSEIYPEIKIFSFFTRNNTISDMIEKQISYYKTRSNIYHNLNITHSDFDNSQILNFSYYLYDIPSLIIKCSELLTTSIIEKKEYHIQYCAEKENYSEHLPVMNKMINSLKTFSISRYEKNLNYEAGLLLKYPTSWNRIENSSSDENISFREMNNPSIHINIFSDNRSVTDLEKSYNQTYQNNEFDIYQKELINLNSTKGKLIPANKITFHYLSSDTLDKSIPVYGIHLYAEFNGYIYSIWYYSRYDTQLSSAQLMLNSIKIMDSYKKSDAIFKNYNDPAISFDIQIPVNWNVTYHSNDEMLLSIPLFENSSEIDYDSSLSIMNIGYPETLNKSLSQIVGDDLSLIIDPTFSYPEEDIKIIDIGKSIENSSAYTIEYTIDSPTYHQHYLNTYLNGKHDSLFSIEYSSSTDKYYNYLPIINYIINSIHVKSKLQSNQQIGINVGEGPSGIVYNPNTNMIYISNEKTDSVSVFDGSNFKKIKTIKVGKNPDDLAVDSSINIIYVANLNSDSISIIDGSQNKELRSIKVGPYPIEVAVNTITHKVYVVDEDSTKLYVIDGPNDFQPDIIPTGGNDLDSGMGVAVNEITNQIYVANPYTQYVTIIDGKTNNILKNFPMTFSSLDLRPFAITVNPFINYAYILSYEPYQSGIYLSGLNLNDYKISINKYLGKDYDLFPTSVFLNKLTNMIYVPMFLNDTLAIIDVTNITLPVKSIHTDSSPYDVAINEKQDIIYSTNNDANTMSIVNAASQHNLFGILYTIKTGIINQDIFGINIPLNSTKDAVLYCNGKRFINNTYMLYDNGTSVECFAKSEMNGRFTPILSSVWYGQDNNHPNKFVVTGHGGVSGKFADFGNFIRLTSPIISLFVLMSVIILSLLPSFIRKIRQKNKFLFVDKRQKELLSKTEIIGIDGSIIVGILFFLTVTEGFEQHEQNEITLITASVILPFALSVIMAITNRENIATRLTLVGL